MVRLKEKGDVSIRLSSKSAFVDQILSYLHIPAKKKRKDGSVEAGMN
jgi:hypothetical protein